MPYRCASRLNDTMTRLRPARALVSATIEAEFDGSRVLTLLLAQPNDRGQWWGVSETPSP